ARRRALSASRSQGDPPLLRPAPRLARGQPAGRHRRSRRPREARPDRAALGRLLRAHPGGGSATRCGRPDPRAHRSRRRDLRQAAGAKLVVYADDGEKFGAWPGTYQRVHKDGWLEDFFSQIAQADFLETTTLEDAWIFQKPSRRVYLPGGTYHEMGEWSLEPAAARRFTQARNALKDDLASLVALPPWRNFLAKYPEANALHKRMLIVSEELARRSIL